MAANCPNCGSQVDLAVPGVKTTTCGACGTSLFIQDDAFELAGEQGVMHDGPMLFDIDDRIILGRQEFHVLGHIRYSYGPGWWDEFWALDPQESPVWISVDEGDVIVQITVPQNKWPRAKTPPKLGGKLSSDGIEYRVIEADQGVCIGFRGTLPTQPVLGETHDFVNCQADTDGLLSGEFWGGERAWFVGEWIDPFDIGRAL